MKHLLLYLLLVSALSAQSNETETGAALGPLVSNGTIKYPKWGAISQNPWRYEIVRLVTAAQVPAEVSFDTP